MTTPLVFQHNWADDLVIKVHWETLIYQSFQASEQRRQNRTTPRLSVSITVTDELKKFFHLNFHDNFYVPIFCDEFLGTRVGSTLVFTETLIFAAFCGYVISDEGDVGLVSSWDTYHVHLSSAMAGTSTRFYPAVIGYVNDQTLPFVTSQIINAKVQFEGI